MSGFIRSVIGVFGGPKAADTNDFRNVPASDRGNAAYKDKGMRGNFGPSNRDQFPDPAGLKRFEGFGASEADLARGYIDDCVSEDPAYDKANYVDRSSQPKRPDEDFGNMDATADDFAFRNRNRTTRGFLTRPRIPTERG